MNKYYYFGKKNKKNTIKYNWDKTTIVVAVIGIFIAIMQMIHNNNLLREQMDHNERIAIEQSIHNEIISENQSKASMKINNETLKFNIITKVFDLAISDKVCNKQPLILTLVNSVRFANINEQILDSFFNLCEEINEKDKKKLLKFLEKSSKLAISIDILDLNTDNRRNARQNLVLKYNSPYKYNKRFIEEEFIKLINHGLNNYRNNLGIIYVLANINSTWSNENLKSMIDKYHNNNNNDDVYNMYYKFATEKYQKKF